MVKQIKRKLEINKWEIMFVCLFIPAAIILGFGILIRSFLSFLLNHWLGFIGVLILVIGLLGEINGRTLFISGGFLLLIIHYVVMKEKERKVNRLILQLKSSDKATATEAFRKLKGMGWRKVLRDADLSGVNLSGANLIHEWIQGTNLNNANLSRARLHGAYMEDVNLSHANLREADLGHITCNRTKLINADLSGVNLSGSHMHRINLYGANLSGANLKQTQLVGANLHGVTLSKAYLWNARLQGANFTMANLSQAYLWNANLRRAIFRFANLEGAKVTPQQLAKAKSLEGALLPDGTKYEDGIWMPIKEKSEAN